MVLTYFKVRQYSFRLKQFKHAFYSGTCLWNGEIMKMPVYCIQSCFTVTHGPLFLLPYI